MSAAPLPPSLAAVVLARLALRAPCTAYVVENSVVLRKLKDVMVSVMLPREKAPGPRALQVALGPLLLLSWTESR